MARSNPSVRSDEATQGNTPRLGEDEFRFISRFVFERFGIVLGDNKRQLVIGRLQRRLRELGMSSFSDYVRRLRELPDDELDSLASAISTNVTSFFRENHHFEFLADTLIPAAMAKPKPSLRIWSAGCSSGEEPYSIAMVVAERLGFRAPQIAEITATDLSPGAVAVARAGVYPIDRLQGVSLARRKRWFRRGIGINEGKAMIARELRDLIRFDILNLLHDWPIQGPLDAIFCRNLVIYFDTPTKQRLFARYAQLLPPGGHLFLGHSESLHGLSDAFDLVGRTIYRRRG